jgi:hypothetical protein
MPKGTGNIAGKPAQFAAAGQPQTAEGQSFQGRIAGLDQRIQSNLQMIQELKQQLTGEQASAETTAQPSLGGEGGATETQELPTALPTATGTAYGGK